MSTFEFRGKRYEVDEDGFLIDSSQWDEDFAQGMAPEAGISGPLSESHRSVISLIRNGVAVTGRCPKVYDICKAQQLRIADMKQLFPAGYLRGVIKIAGLPSRQTGSALPAASDPPSAESKEQTGKCSKTSRPAPRHPARKLSTERGRSSRAESNAAASPVSARHGGRANGIHHWEAAETFRPGAGP